MSLLSKRTSRVDSSGIRRVFELARSMKDPINLSIGQPDFDVPELVKAAAVNALDTGHHTHTPTTGNLSLIHLSLCL
mgnify:CR=1 FL=1